jgi:hypothetical protein
LVVVEAEKSMADPTPPLGTVARREYRFVLVGSFIALAVTSAPYVLGAALATDQRVFGGFVYAVEDCYSYLAKMRQGAEGAWLFHIPYTPEPHPGALIYSFYLLLGKIAGLLPGRDLTLRMVCVHHIARAILGLGLLLTVYRFLAAFTRRVIVRRLAWLMVTFSGGLGWLLVAMGRSDWLGSMPLDFILPEGFTFLVLYAFPHIALGRTLLLLGILSLLQVWQPNHRVDSALHGSDFASHSQGSGAIKWGVLAGLLWLLMGLIVPFYVAVAWAVAGAACAALALREGQLLSLKTWAPALAVITSAPIVLYSAWRFTSDPIYGTWAAQNRVLSPHPLHYLAAYGVPLALAALAARDAWRGERPTWLALAWVGVVPLLIYLPFNVQRRLVEGVQVPLSLLAAIGLTKIADAQPRISSLRSRLAVGMVLVGLLPTNVILIAGSSMALRGQPTPIFRDVEEVAALDWLSRRVDPHDVVLASYGTGNYLPARVGARAFVGHGPESANAEQKRALVASFFRETTDDLWRRRLLMEYGVDYVFWGPKERNLGAFEPGGADYLQPVYERNGYLVLEVIG